VVKLIGICGSNERWLALRKPVVPALGKKDDFAVLADEVRSLASQCTSHG